MSQSIGKGSMKYAQQLHHSLSALGLSKVEKTEAADPWTSEETARRGQSSAGIHNNHWLNNMIFQVRRSPRNGQGLADLPRLTLRPCSLALATHWNYFLPCHVSIAHQRLTSRLSAIWVWQGGSIYRTCIVYYWSIYKR